MRGGSFVLVEVRLYATLRQHAPAAAVSGIFSVDLPQRSNVNDLLHIIHINSSEVHILMVNGIGVTVEHILNEYDRVGLFHPVGGG